MAVEGFWADAGIAATDAKKIQKVESSQIQVRNCGTIWCNHV